MAKTLNRKKKRKRSRKFPHNIPHWALWVGGIFIVSVYVFVFYYFFVSPFSFRWKGIFGNKGYPAGYSIHGIDISHHQGEIDWATVAQSGINFAIIRSTLGGGSLDEKFEQNYAGATANGLGVAVYHYSYAKTTEKACLGCE